MNRLKDKVAIVTGSTSGIGKGIAKMFAAEGARVVVCGRREERGAAIVDEIQSAGGEAMYHFLDVTKPEIFRALYDAAYPIERMVLIDEYDAQDGPSIRANNSSAFNFRFIAGTGVLSNHSRGMAVDINPLYTPYVKTNGGRTVVAPAEAAPYAERKRDFPYKIAEDAPCCREFLRHGFTWGGHWKSLKDYQHFEKKQ